MMAAKEPSRREILIASDPLRMPVERIVSEYTGRPWIVHAVIDMADYASHPAALLSDGAYSVFAKFDG